MIIFPEHFDQALLLEQASMANEITLNFHARRAATFLFLLRPEDLKRRDKD
jgi:hypothetical protein